MKQISAIVMAAGLGKRMRSKKAKVLHPVAGRPMVWYMTSLARRVADGHVVVVVGHQGEQVKAFLDQEKKALEPLDIAVQVKQLGTGHAVQQAKSVLMPKGKPVSELCLILNGDTPLLTQATVQRLMTQHQATQAAVTILTTELENPQGYGRVLRRPNGQVIKVVEDKDATAEEKSNHEVNVGTYLVNSAFLFKALDSLKPNNAQGEYYLTDIIGLAVAQGLRVGGMKTDDADECFGVNSREHLAFVEHVMRGRIRSRWLAEGVTMLDPNTTFIDDNVEIGQDTVLYPCVTIEGTTKIGCATTIRSHSRLTNSVVGDGVIIEDSSILDGAVVEEGASIGPFARLRPGSIVRTKAKVGNFVELKNVELGEGSKANHLTYLGDATIGKQVNIGAGTITCNYDGFRKERTVIEDGVFIGSDSQLVAPVTIGKGAVVAAGSTVTQNVPADGLTLSRTEQVNREGWAARRRAMYAKDGAKAKKNDAPKGAGRKSKALKKKTL
ncbi:MAG: bifunctional UDP-N-acetylglucosamine diphosphorylase/glucosamine-1-phosphate N-acetyltransferase GlmU [Nitrospirae bacterium]|nr:bifunctional UDP-N-acetylglucosamine diphosphorylase/glucosamine-1-phosphate N-acetyltransferase GlmU [Nitrospirota bacterium]MDA1305535.1 bifunctional UDP-N-acetylglucosamine diphosphorylase/glucosamine-1-phosphate N-acetyltransferase GlmU [Nitrospirota bacterium]